MIAFFTKNARWLAAGFLLLFSSSFGQTFFVSLSGGAIRSEFGLSNGAFGTLYMAVTLVSALALAYVGKFVDGTSARRIVLPTIVLLALGAAGLAIAPNLAVLAFSFFLLRLMGQGMMVHSAYTLLGRWFSGERGKAVSMSSIGLNVGQALLPLVFVAATAVLGWRNVWLGAALFLIFLVLPSAWVLLRKERMPEAGGAAANQQLAQGATRAEVLRDPYFYLLLLAMLPPAFISNTIFFHQVYLAQLRGWSIEVMASAFPLYAAVSVACVLIAGQVVDRKSALAILPYYLLPFGIGCLILGSVGAPWAAFAFMLLYGVMDGFSLTLFGTLWPEIYGTRHLGAIRAVLVAIMVFASALGPGLAGILIDGGVSLLAIIIVMGLYCLGVSALMLVMRKRIAARAHEARAYLP